MQTNTKIQSLMRLIIFLIITSNIHSQENKNQFFDTMFIPQPEQDFKRYICK